jgi:hypothetical protein
MKVSKKRCFEDAEIYLEGPSMFKLCIKFFLLRMHSHVFLLPLFPPPSNLLKCQKFYQSSHFQPLQHLSTIPITCAIPLVSGCRISGNTISLSAFSSVPFPRNPNRPIYMRSITLVFTYPCKFGVCGQHCNDIISSTYQDPGISMSVFAVGGVGQGSGCVQSLALAVSENAGGIIGGTWGRWYGLLSWYESDEL